MSRRTFEERAAAAGRVSRYAMRRTQARPHITRILGWTATREQRAQEDANVTNATGEGQR